MSELPVPQTKNGSEIDNEDSGEVPVLLHRAQDSHVVYRPLSAAPKAVLDFSDFSSPEQVVRLCIERVPGWQEVEPETLRVSQLCEGLSNQIFKVSLSSVGSGSPISQRSSAVSQFPRNRSNSGSNSRTPLYPYTSVLFRVHGKDSGALYDQKEELKIFKTLSKYQIGPQLIANGEGWRIEEWHYSIPIPVKALPNPSIFGQVASALGRFHRLHKRRDFPTDLSRKPVTLVRLDSWAANAAKAKVGEVQGIQAMLDEAVWLKQFILGKIQAGEAGQTERENRSYGFDVVFAHNDCQENNLLQTPYGLRMIDFEYAGFNYQAYDVANFFCEFTMDYTEKQYPFYASNTDAFPNRTSQELFAAIYLSEYLETPVLPGDNELINPFLEAVEIFTLASHLLWALWSVIRAPQSPTFDQFDFIHYANFRFECYKTAKQAVLAASSKSGSLSSPRTLTLLAVAALLGIASTKALLK